MPSPSRLAARLLLLLALSLAACGDGPEKLTRAELEAERARGSAPAPAHSPAASTPGLPPGHPPMGEHPPLGDGGQGEVVALAGEIELAGPLADLQSGSIFVVGYDEASGSMLLVTKYTAADLARERPGEARLPFVMSQVHPTASGAPGALVLEVRVDLDGMVETKEDIVATTRVPASMGDREVSVRLDETARTGAPLPGEAQ